MSLVLQTRRIRQRLPLEYSIRREGPADRRKGRTHVAGSSSSPGRPRELHRAEPRRYLPWCWCPQPKVTCLDSNIFETVGMADGCRRYEQFRCHYDNELWLNSLILREIY